MRQVVRETYHACKKELAKPKAEMRNAVKAIYEPFTNEENNAERLLNYPMLEIKNAQAGENQQAEQRKQLIAPFHERRSESGWLWLSINPVTAGNRLSALASPAKVEEWQVR